MNTYTALKKVYIALNMLNANYADGTMIVELQNLPMFAKQSLLKTIYSNGFENTNGIAKIVNAGDENDAIFIVIMADENWPMTVDGVLSPSGNQSFVISLPERLFVDIESDEAAPIIYHIFSDLAQYDSNLLYTLDANIINGYGSQSGVYIPTYDLIIQMYVIYLANTLIKSWWPDNNLIHDDMNAFLSSIDYDTIEISRMLKTLNDKDEKTCIENFMASIEL